jgi:hypothetical protein
MTDDKPYRSVIQAGRPPFQPARAELVEELKLLLAYRPNGLGDLDLPLEPTERLAIEKAMKARACELLRTLYPFRPTASDWEREDIITSRAHETGVDDGRVHEARPLNERVEVCILGAWQGGTLLSEEPGGGLVVRPDDWMTASTYAPEFVRRAPVHEPPPNGDSMSAAAPELLGHDAVGLPIHRNVRVEAIDLDPPAFARAIGSRDKWLTVVFDDHEVSDSIEMSRVRVLVPTEAEQLREAQRRLAQPYAAVQQYATLRAVIRRLRHDSETVLLSAEHGAMRLSLPNESRDVWLPSDIMEWRSKAEAVKHVDAALDGLLGPVKVRELARDLLDALHDPGPDDGAHLMRLQRTARPLAEFILGERDA